VIYVRRLKTLNKHSRRTTRPDHYCLYCLSRIRPTSWVLVVSMVPRAKEISADTEEVEVLQKSLQCATHLPGARRNSTASVVLLLGVNVHTAHTPEEPASQSHSAVEVSSKTQIILWICTVRSESQPYSCVKFNSAETLFYVLSKSFPENSLFAKVYIRQQYQTFFNNTRRKCAVQNQTYSRAKFNSAETLFYVQSISFPENGIFAEVYIPQKY